MHVGKFVSGDMLHVYISAMQNYDVYDAYILLIIVIKCFVQLVIASCIENDRSPYLRTPTHV